MYAPTPLIIAHRGASAYAPENTLAAFRMAIESGADGVEFDVRLAMDSVAVVCHDDSLFRTAGIDANVSDVRSSDLIGMDAAFAFRRSKNISATERPSEWQIPSLGQTLHSLRDYEGLIYIELKSGDDDVEPLVRAVRDELLQQPVKGKVVIKCFALPAIRVVRDLLPGVRTAALFEPSLRMFLGRDDDLVSLAEDAGADEISLHRSLVMQKLVQRAADRGIPVLAWTVDHPRWVKRAVRTGLFALITNDPAKLIAKRSEL